MSAHPVLGILLHHRGGALALAKAAHEFDPPPTVPARHVVGPLHRPGRTLHQMLLGRSLRSGLPGVEAGVGSRVIWVVRQSNPEVRHPIVNGSFIYSSRSAQPSMFDKVVNLGST